jgi:PPK2 family polyphosphate:nucleotide phosphotransferase
MADKRAARIAELIKPLRVKPGSKVNLARDFDPGYKAGFLKKKDGAELLQTGIAMLADYQARLAAQDTYGVLVCLQALDAGGKDGTIRHVMSGVNPQGVQVTGFKVPSAEELDHDYLWRYARHLPARGDIGIFNRSHYEEVLVVRVHPENLDRQRLPAGARGKGIWERRYREINDWERYLTDNGFKVVKLFLNLSKEEQRARFLKRIDLPEKNWKFSAADVRERGNWDDYQKAFSEMLSATSTRWAPWYVIPADHKWFARICAAGVIVHTLIEIDPRYPEVSEDRRQQLQAVKAELEAEAPKGAPADPFAAKEAGAKAKAAAEAEAKAAEEAKKAAEAEARAATEATAAARTAADAAAKAKAAARMAARAAAGQAAGDGRRPSEADNKGRTARASRARGGGSTRGRPAQTGRRTSRTQANGQPGSET